MTLLALLAGTATTVTPSPPDPPGPAWRNVVYGTRIQIPNHTHPEVKTETSTLTVMAQTEEVRFTFTNPDTKAPTTWECSVNGQPVTFNGQEQGEAAAGHEVTSDVMPWAFAAGDTIEVTTTGTSIGGHLRVAEPARVEAVHDGPSVLVIGSSSGMPEDFTRGMKDAGLPVVNGSTGGTMARTFTTDMLRDAFGMGKNAGGYTHVFLQVGINAASHGAANLASHSVTLGKNLKNLGGVHVTQMVWKPYTSSTDGWTTVEGQTPRHESRQTVVDWMRRGAPLDPATLTPHAGFVSTGESVLVGDDGHPWDEICDWSSLIQSQENPDAFRVDHGPLSTDGLHINATGYELGRPVLRDWAQAVMDGWVPAG